MQKRLVLAATAAFGILAGCAHESAPVGGSVGAIEGSKSGASVGGGGGGSLVVGNMASAGIRNLVNQQMNDQDRMRVAQVLEFNRAGAASSWVDPKSNTAYTVTPGPTYNTPQGECRNFTALANVGGNPEQSQGTGCRAPDGRWEIVK